MRWLGEWVMPEPKVLLFILSCPNCGTDVEGIWLEPEDPEENVPEPAEQLCGECANIWQAPWPGYTFRTEA